MLQFLRPELIWPLRGAMQLTTNRNHVRIPTPPDPRILCCATVGKQRQILLHRRVQLEFKYSLSAPLRMLLHDHVVRLNGHNR